MTALDMTYSNAKFIFRGVNLAVFLTAAAVASVRLLQYHFGRAELDAFDWPFGVLFGTLFIELALRCVDQYWTSSDRRGFPVEKKDKR
jgi:hypothetical protein